MTTNDKGSKPGLDPLTFPAGALAPVDSPTQQYDSTFSRSRINGTESHANATEVCFEESKDSASSSNHGEKAGDARVNPRGGGPSVDEAGNVYPEGGREAYLVTLSAFAAMCACFGPLNTVGVLQAYVSEHQLAGYDESTVSWIFSVYIFLVFFCGLQIGPIFDARGPRTLMITGSVCLLVAMFTLGLCTEYYQFMLCQGILAGLGSSLLFTPAVASISHYFNRRRATFTGLSATGGSFMGVIFPLMLQRLLPQLGWAWSTRIMGFIVLLLCAVAVTFTGSRLSAKDRLKAEVRAGDRLSDTTSLSAATNWSAMVPSPRIFYPSSPNGTAVLVTAIGVYCLEWGLFVPIAYLPQYALATGISPTFSYQLVAVFNAASCFGRYCPGYVADKLGRFNTILGTVVMCIASVFGLWLPAALCNTHTASLGLVVAFSIVFGFASGSNISLTPNCVGQLCDTRQYGRYYATVYTLVSFSSLTGIPLAGALINAVGTNSPHPYWGVVVFTGACYVAAFVCFAWVRVNRCGWSLTKIW